MDKQEFKKFWEDCIEPTFKEFSIRDGSFDSLCRRYNDIKNITKRIFMKKSGDVIKLDRHKIAACMAKAIVLDRPICRKVGEDYTGIESDFIIANEALPFSVSMSILKAYIELKLGKGNFASHEEAYRKICDLDFVFPETIMHVDYKTSVCWAWHHNITDGYFDVLGTANLFFMIENYSIAVYSKA